ncbi:DUF3427 domain-containing protein [Enhygromyxa salina]|uniref:ATP-dependent RNA helicase SrmB n=1 Tax=Enhygromyxa salina TaxID=215803 RepID=A0A2S9YPL0_9BACT|nr:DUF3427 domain-containing protein [Enhygromyxa salina]PRQ07020.1 ATP-dependent RNA helicase SrmB [Enhygromyxa salina]
MALRPGLHETLLTREVAEALEAIDPRFKDVAELSDEAAAELLTRHVTQLLHHVLRQAKKDRAGQLQLVNELVTWLGDQAKRGEIDEHDRVAPPGRVLRSLLSSDEIRLAANHPPRPLISPSHSDLLVNGPRDVRLGHLVARELPSADRVDILISFLKYSGLRVILDPLRRFIERRPGQLRVLTTTYLGATELRALDTLQELGAQVRLSYDSRRTRLHAKAWLFHRDSGFSTAVVGSSNLSHSALLDGCEWNVRVGQIDNATVHKKLETTFEQYWSDEGSFEPFDRERFLDDLDAQRRPDADRDAIARAIDIRPHPHQQTALDALAAERDAGHHQNLVVAATGTGKTVIAALDFRRLQRERGPLSLLFVAHREEILRQSLGAFRAVLRDGNFGRRLEPDRPLERDRHLFASVQSLHEGRLAELRPEAYDVVIVDEFHHAAAPTYDRLLSHLRPKILLGLTATPERADGQSILAWFEQRIAYEIRLWDALDLGLLSPFHYFGVHDETDLSTVDFRAGRYDTRDLERLYTADDVRARAVLRATQDKVADLHAMRALGFCVSVEHAEFMAAWFQRAGVPALAVSGKTSSNKRAAALRALRDGTVKILFAVDLFNEGVDLPAVDTVLFLRPTESATVFLQQLGRGLRLAEGKDCLTVLDFIGDGVHERFRFDQRFAALVGGTRAQVKGAVEAGFPHLPAGCEILLDHRSQEIVVESIERTLRLGRQELARDLAAIGDVGLRRFLDQAGVELDQVYGRGGTYTELLHRAGLREGPAPKHATTRAMERLLHVDDPNRLGTWRRWLTLDKPLRADPSDPLQLMLFVAAGHVRRPIAELSAAWDELWAAPDLRRELAELMGVLDDRRRRPTLELPGLAPLRIHATYSRDEVIAGLGELRQGKLLRLQGGVYRHQATRSDLLFVTLDKDAKQFTPTTLYEDYPISRERFHWESQGRTRADSETGRRYQNHRAMDWNILLFVRQRTHERGVTSPYTFLGPVDYESHEREKPMRIIWRLHHAMPPELWSDVKVAAG